MRNVIEAAYGEAIGDIFLAALPLALITVVAVCLLPNARLGTKTGVEQLAEEAGDAAIARRSQVSSSSNLPPLGAERARSLLFGLCRPTRPWMRAWPGSRTR